MAFFAQLKINLEMPDLDIPPAQPPVEGKNAFRKSALENWLGQQPLGEVLQAADCLRVRLDELNHAELPLAVREEACGVLLQPAEQVIHALRRTVTAMAFPLSGRQQEAADRLILLTATLATSLRVLLDARLKGKPKSKKQWVAATHVLQQASHYLARVIVDSYRIYRAEPVGTWSTMHKLFFLMERLSVEDWQEFSSVASEQIAAAIDDYKRAALLALSNPFHLVPGEVDTINEYLEEWVGAATMIRPDKGVDLQGQYLVMLDTDLPPTYRFDPEKARSDATRLLDCSGVVARVQETAGIEDVDGHVLLQTGKGLPDRIRMGGLLRLADLWQVRKKRRFPRIPQTESVEMALGLPASHFFVGGGHAFEPEIMEKRLAHGMYRRPEAADGTHGQGGGAAGYNTDPFSITSQPTRDTRPGSQAVFASQSRDVWDTIYANPSEVPAHAVRQGGDPEFLSHVWRERNASLGGFSVSCQPGNCHRISVGEILVFSPIANDGMDWSLGVVQWMQITGDGQMDVGIRTLHGPVISVATRGVSGAGGGGGYQRALILSERDPRRQDRRMASLPECLTDSDRVSVFLPPGVYDKGSVIGICVGEGIHYVQIDELLEATHSYSRFTFRHMEMPLSEKERLRHLS